MAKKQPAATSRAKGKTGSPSTAALVAAGLRREKRRLTEIKRLAGQIERERVRAERALRDLAHAVAEDTGHRLVARDMLEELESQRVGLMSENLTLRTQVDQLLVEKLERDSAATTDASTR